MTQVDKAADTAFAVGSALLRIPVPHPVFKVIGVVLVVGGTTAKVAVTWMDGPEKRSHVIQIGMQECQKVRQDQQVVVVDSRNKCSNPVTVQISK